MSNEYSLRPKKTVVLEMNLDRCLLRFISKTTNFLDGGSS
jgi:hypothetical protein